MHSDVGARARGAVVKKEEDFGTGKTLEALLTELADDLINDGAGAESMDDAAAKLRTWHTTAAETYEAGRSDYNQKWADQKADDATGIAPF